MNTVMYIRPRVQKPESLETFGPSEARRSVGGSATARLMRRLPSVAVVGLGGVGGAVAASLATAGTCELTCVARGAGLDTLRRHGLRVTLHDKRVVSCGAVRAVEADVRATRAIGVQDTLILTTKAHQLDASLEAIAPLIGPSTSIVPLQNGLPHWFFAGFGGKALDGTDLRSIDPNGRLRRALPPSQCVGAVGFVAGSTRDAPDGSCREWFCNWPPERSTITLGDAMTGDAQSRAHEVASLFRSESVELPTRCVDDIRSVVMSKLLVNASINTLSYARSRTLTHAQQLTPSHPQSTLLIPFDSLMFVWAHSALTRLDCGELTADDGLRKALRAICDEVADVAAAITPPVALTTDADAVLKLYGGQFGLRSSMLQDLESGRPLEHAPIVSALVEVGQRLGVSVPRLEMVDALLDALSPSASAKL